MSLFLCEVMPRICGTLHSVRHRSKTLSSTVLPTTTQTLNSSQIRNNCHRASITRIHRSVYPRPYKTMLCLQDGSTITVRTREPYKIMVMSDDLKTMSEEEKLERFGKRRRQDKLVATDEFEDDFDFGEYVK